VSTRPQLGRQFADGPFWALQVLQTTIRNDHVEAFIWNLHGVFRIGYKKADIEEAKSGRVSGNHFVGNVKTGVGTE